MKEGDIIVDSDGTKYKLVKVKEEKKTYALFILTMPKVGSWNGKWSGEGEVFAKSKKVFDKGKLLFPNLKEGKFTYDFEDGWVAMIEVKFVTPSESKDMMKKSKGFCGYSWMIDSLIETGRIIDKDDEEVYSK